MKTLYLSISMLLCVFMTSNAQVEVGDATLPSTVTFNAEELVLNGAGVREKFFFDIYAAGLYLKKKSTKSIEITNADETMAMKLHILSGMMSREKMADALRSGFEKATNGNTAVLSERIETFIGFINTEIAVDQVYDITYEKGKGSRIYKDGVAKGTITGLDFKKALFEIWIGTTPADKGLKNELLGL